MDIVLLIILFSFIFNLLIIRNVVYSNKYEFEISVNKKIAYVILFIVTIFNCLLLFVSNLEYSFLIIYSVFFSMLSIVGVIDLITFYVFPYLLYFYTFLGIISMYVFKNFDIVSSVYSMISGLVIYGTIYFVSKLIYKREAFGVGDLYIIASVGIFQGINGFQGIINTILISFLAFYVSIIFIVIKKILKDRVNMLDEIPFGPSIAIAAIIVSIYGKTMIDMYKVYFGL